MASIWYITEQALFGISCQSIMRHPAEQSHLYPGHSTNTEKNEATFNTLKTFTNLTQGSLPNYFKNMHEIILVTAKNHAKNMFWKICEVSSKIIPKQAT